MRHQQSTLIEEEEGGNSLYDAAHCMMLLIGRQTINQGRCSGKLVERQPSLLTVLQGSQPGLYEQNPGLVTLHLFCNSNVLRQSGNQTPYIHDFHVVDVVHSRLDMAVRCHYDICVTASITDNKPKS